jgi:hypothetical protein
MALTPTTVEDIKRAIDDARQALDALPSDDATTAQQQILAKACDDLNDVVGIVAQL